jgi:hypothetical protein
MEMGMDRGIDKDTDVEMNMEINLNIMRKYQNVGPSGIRSAWN